MNGSTSVVVPDELPVSHIGHLLGTYSLGVITCAPTIKGMLLALDADPAKGILCPLHLIEGRIEHTVRVIEACFGSKKLFITLPKWRVKNEEELPLHMLEYGAHPILHSEGSEALTALAVARRFGCAPLASSKGPIVRRSKKEAVTMCEREVRFPTRQAVLMRHLLARPGIQLPRSELGQLVNREGNALKNFITEVRRTLLREGGGRLLRTLVTSQSGVITYVPDRYYDQ